MFVMGGGKIFPPILLFGKLSSEILETHTGAVYLTKTLKQHTKK